METESTEELARQVGWRLQALWRKFCIEGRTGSQAAAEVLRLTRKLWLEFELEAGLTLCQCEIGLPPGVLWPWVTHDAEPPAGWSWVERCDDCRRFSSDAHAAGALLAAGTGTQVQWFACDPGRRHEDSRPGAEGWSCAIGVASDFPLGARSEFTFRLERDGFVALPGLTGTVTAAEPGFAGLRIDKPLPGAAGNTVRFTRTGPRRHPVLELLTYAAVAGGTRGLG